MTLQMLLAAPSSSAAEQPPFQKRGDEVEASYHAYTARLAKDHGLILTTLGKEAPRLAKKLIREAPQPVPVGYQILPKLTGDDPQIMAMRFTGPVAVSYSWGKTQAYINWETSKVEELEEKLNILPKLESKDREPVLAKIVEDFVGLEGDQKTVDEHLQYNRFWQKAVAEDRPRFDRLTILHDMVLELQSLRSQHKLSDEMQQRAESDEKTIAEEADHIVPVNFLKFIVSKSGDCTITVPLASDIEDSAFLAKTKQAIESTWNVRSLKTNHHFRIRIDLRKISAKALYRKEPTPRHGAQVDVEKHTARFAHSIPFLTTGANMTYAIPGRYIVLGPHPMSYRVLAHEFGHILGFIDHYFRGYRDLGKEGFEILEVVSDPKNLMASPETGEALIQHFEKLIRTDAPPRLAQKFKPAL